MTPGDFRKIRALERASLYAREALAMMREAYVADPNTKRRYKLDEVMTSLQEYEDMTSIALNEVCEKLMKDQT